jgi:hypothetical protein
LKATQLGTVSQNRAHISDDFWSLAVGTGELIFVTEECKGFIGMYEYVYPGGSIATVG